MSECPSCGQPRPEGVGEGLFVVGSVCPHCGHVETETDDQPGEFFTVLRIRFDAEGSEHAEGQLQAMIATLHGWGEVDVVDSGRKGEEVSA